MCVLLRNLYLYISFSISCCLVVIVGRVLVIVGESVVEAMENILPTPPTPIYFIGKGYDNSIITPYIQTKIVTFLGDKM
jgi:hypothetical protein